MNTYMVWLRLTAESSDELLSRINGWEVGDDEGVVTVTHEPETVQIPAELQVPPPPSQLPGAPVEPDEPDEAEPPVETEPPDDGKPHIYSVDPASGPTTGGATLTMHGSGLTGIGGVNFQRGDEVGWAWGFTVIDDQTITATTPPMAAGAVDVVAVADPDDAVLADGFTYVEP